MDAAAFGTSTSSFTSLVPQKNARRATPQQGSMHGHARTRVGRRHDHAGHRTSAAVIPDAIGADARGRGKAECTGAKVDVGEQVVQTGPATAPA